MCSMTAFQQCGSNAIGCGILPKKCMLKCNFLIILLLRRIIQFMELFLTNLYKISNWSQGIQQSVLPRLCIPLISVAVYCLQLTAVMDCLEPLHAAII